MDILTANSITTIKSTTKIEEINIKYKKERENLKKVIVETARSHTEQILADNTDDNPDDGNTSDAFRVLFNGEVRINDSYTLPKRNGTDGQVLTCNSNGIATWENK